jgi:PPK2 family polyphosphate:nucleotide phosphotransferase
VLEHLRVKPGEPPRLTERDPRETLGLEKEAAKERRRDLTRRIDELQYRLHAEGTRAFLLVLQGLDASGKDGVIRRVFSGVNPQGVRVVAFKAPVGEELRHDCLWRIHRALPERGMLGVFNRSHYEDIVTVRVRGLAPDEVWRTRPAHVREFERMLTDEGTAIVKVFLHVSKEEQAARLRERLEDPLKRWKFRVDDLAVNDRYDEFMAAYEEALAETSTDWAPWYVVPADRNWVKAYATAALVAAALERLDPTLPSAVL